MRQEDCQKKSIVEGDSSNMIGCGIATNFGHTRSGGKDPDDDGQVFCNTKNEKEKYTFRKDRSPQENLKVEFAALRMNDVSKLFNIGLGKKQLMKGNSKFCGKMITIKNMGNGKVTQAKLMDIMSNNNRVIDLTGAVLLKLGSTKGNPKVQITWSDQPQLK
jgi:hypothetical protein